jgi:RimJ/RimL family protein N-acetyltransferase
MEYIFYMTEFVTLSTERLKLRPLTENDLHHLIELDQDPAVMEFLGNQVNSTAFLENLLSNILKRQTKVFNYGVWMADEISTGETIGWFSLEPIPQFQNEFEIGARIKPRFWRKGYAAEGFNFLVDYGFNDLKLSKIIGCCHVNNEKSQQLLLKCGLVRAADIPSPFPKKFFGDYLAKFEIYK